MAALAGVLAVTAAWWALALWPVAGPDWLQRTRYVCFGVAETGLPDIAGWMVLLLQPASMVGLVAVIWGGALPRGIRALWARIPGRVAVTVTTAAMLLGVGVAGIRVARAQRAADLAWPEEPPIPSLYERLDRPAPALELVDQHGDTVSLAALRGEAVLVTFAFAHCRTICPTIVRDAQLVRRALSVGRPRVLIVTLDPWRDVPSRLPAIAASWGLAEGEHVLSGAVPDVEAVLDAWEIARARDERTGDVVHPRLVFLVTPEGRIAYAASGGRDTIRALLDRTVHESS